MKFKKLSSGVLAATLLMSSGVSFANEVPTEKVNVEKIKDMSSSTTTTSKEVMYAQEKASMNEVASKKSMQSRETHPDFVLGETRTIEMPKMGRYEACVDVPSTGLLTVITDIPKDLVTNEDTLYVYVKDEEGKIIQSNSLKPGEFDGSKNMAFRVGLKPGRYTLDFFIGDSYSFPLKVKVTFESNKNVEIENNETDEKANEIKMGTAYKGSLSNYEYDTFKINVSKDTRVKVYMKETKSMGKTKESVIRIELANGKTEYIRTNYENIAALDLTLKKGDNYLQLWNNAGLTDYSIKVSALTGPFMPRVNTVADCYEYVSGETEKGTSVYVKVGNGSYKRCTVSTSNRFTLKTGKVKAGTIVSVYAKNSSGQNSSVVKVKSEDWTAPANPKLDKFTVKSTKVTGTTEANAFVACRIDKDETRVFLTKANSKGKFSFEVGKLSRGTLIEVQAMDDNENYSFITEMRVQNYVAAPTVNNFSDINVNVTGTGPKGTTIYVKAGSKYYKGKVNSSGKYSIKIPKQKYKSVLKVYAKASNGDTSVVVSKTVGYAPKKPVVNAVTTKSTKITGKSSKNATITVKIGSKTYTGKTTSNGNFSIKIPKQKKGTKITVQAKFNSTGLKSYSTAVTVK